MKTLTLEDFFPTGEYRPPQPGELYIPAGTQKVQESIFGHRSSEPRIIVKERSPRRGTFVPTAREDQEHDEKKEIVDDAREAALLVLTKLVLDDGIGWEARACFAGTILELT